MKLKIPIVVMMLAFGVSQTSMADVVSDITKALDTALKKYCVPPDEYNCNPQELATYTNGKCVPNYPERVWVPSLRLAKELKCPTGYRRVFVSNGICPAGTRKVWIPSHKTTLCKIHNFIGEPKPIITQPVSGVNVSGFEQ